MTDLHPLTHLLRLAKAETAATALLTSLTELPEMAHLTPHAASLLRDVSRARAAESDRLTRSRAVAAAK